MSYLPVAFFSRVLKPGEGLEVELEEASAILTSVTFGEAVKGDKRSTLSLTYLDRMADPEEQIAAMAEDEEDKEGDDDDDSDVSFNTHAVMRKAVIASLLPGKIENAAINVTLNSGEVYELSVSGNNEVHVTGQYVLFPTDQENEDDSDSDDEDSELDSDEFGEYDPETGLLGGEITGLTDGEDGSDIEEDPSRFEELKETPKKTKALPQAEKVKKAETEADTSMDVADVSLASADTSKLSKNQKKKLKKLEKQQKPDDGEAKAAEVALKATSTPAAADAKKGAAAEKAVEESSDAKKPSKKQTLPSGLVIEDAKVGKGPSAKRGQNLAMRYIGKLPNGKIFDQNTKGQPFKFKLGVGEVIKGWDEGLKGMAAGGERKLTIPAAMAYGKKGVDGIPGGATLHFDVKLLSIK